MGAFVCLNRWTPANWRSSSRRTLPSIAPRRLMRSSWWALPSLTRTIWPSATIRCTPAPKHSAKVNGGWVRFNDVCGTKADFELADKETTMPSNDEIIRNLYAVAEKEPKRFRSLFTKNGYWWDVPAGVKYQGDEVARAADIYSAAFPDMHRELHDLYFDGDVVVVQLTLHGTHRGDLPMGLGTLPEIGRAHV